MPSVDIHLRRLLQRHYFKNYSKTAHKASREDFSRGSSKRVMIESPVLDTNFMLEGGNPKVELYLQLLNGLIWLF